MATKPMKPKPAKVSEGRTQSTSPRSEQALADPLADVPLLGPVTDRFTIQPGEITFIKVGSIEVVTHPSSEEDETEPTTPPAGQPGERAEDET